MPKIDHPRPVPEERLRRLADSAGRRPRIALMGEFSSGKSTLLNLLIGEEILPTKVTATELPPVWFSHGAPRAFWVGKDGSRHPMDFGTFAGVPMSARYVRVFAPAPVLEHCDVIDTPGISDPNLEEDSWRFAVGQANFILWCTSATQAWRETERSTWTSLPERLRANSTLVVTRSDKLGPGDKEKVARRLSRESFGLFGGLVFLSSLDALRGRADQAETGDPDLWTRSGGADLEARIESGIESVRAARLDLLERYESTGPSPRPVLAAPSAPVVEEPEPMVRPRRIELPEGPRDERPAADPSADPLAAMRAGPAWMPPQEAGEASAPVLRLTEPVWAEPWSDGAEASVPPGPAEPEAGEAETDSRMAGAVLPPDPAPMSAGESASIEAVLAAVAGEAPPPAAEVLPRAVRIWRDIVARNPEIPPNSPILAMIDQLLCELSRDGELSDDTGLTSATIIERDKAA